MGFSPNDPNAAQDRARMMMAVVVSLVILVAYHFLFEAPRQKELAAQQAAAKAAQVTSSAEKPKPTGVDAMTTSLPAATAAPVTVAKDVRRIPVKGARVSGFLTTLGGRIDELTLNEHYKTVEKIDHVDILAPIGTKHPKYVESGWMAGPGVKVPSGDTVWTVTSGPSELVSNGEPVVMSWDNGQGLTFTRSVAIDENFLFTIKQSVRNNSGTEVRLHTYNAYARQGIPEDFAGFYTLHEGPIGYLNNKEYDPSYADLAKHREEWVQVDQAKGWIGITDKYWMVALLPDPQKTVKARAVCKVALEDCTGGLNNPPGQQFQADVRSMELVAPAGGEVSDTTHIYAGVKNYDIMNGYSKKYGFDQLENGIDFGIYYLITKPFYFLLHWLIKTAAGFASHNVALAMLLMTVIVRICIFPLASTSFRSMAKMKIIAPKLKELQEQYKNDKAKMQEEIYALYKRENANPFSGCWPLIVQIPIFFALYKVILISVELRHAPFWGWIHDLSAPDPTTVFNLFGLINWHPPYAFLMIGAWPCLFCLSMVIQKRITPPLTDQTQERIQTWFPYIATLMMSQFAAGLIIYWTWSNTLSFLQQYYILRKYGGEDTSLIRGHADRRRKPKNKQA